MIINNTHVQGIFIYSPELEFEKGDFVVSGNSIYICTAANPTNIKDSTVSGVDPSTDTENFTIYLCDKITSSKEYFDYLNNPGNNVDKLITSHTLSEILSTYMSGFDEKGIINNYINYDSDSLSYSESLSEILKTATSSNVLDKILIESTLNNSIFRISRNLPEIKSSLPTIPEDIDIPENDKLSIILRQYTYIDSSNNSNLYRIQELIDHVNSIIMYRYATGENFINKSQWKSSFVNKNFRDEVQYVKNYYINKVTELQAEKELLENNFRFRNIEIPKSDIINIQCTNEDQFGYIPIDSFTNSTVITMIIQESKASNLFKNSSITIDLSNSLGSGPILEYYVSDNNTLRLYNTSNTEMTIQITSGKIINLYYRQYYNK